MMSRTTKRLVCYRMFISDDFVLLTLIFDFENTAAIVAFLIKILGFVSRTLEGQIIRKAIHLYTLGN
jgi:hypothetical protein